MKNLLVSWAGAAGLTLSVLGCSAGTPDASNPEGGSGGIPEGVGGQMAADGGAPGPGTGGAPESAGGASVSTGGVVLNAGGGPSSGGSPPAGGASGGALVEGPPAVRWFGRVVPGQATDEAQMAWSGTGFVARFEGTGLSFEHSGAAVEYAIRVDGQEAPKLVGPGTQQLLTAASGLSAGIHTVEVQRRSEALFGVTKVANVTVQEGELLAAPARTTHLIEIVGDSISCGYGNEGAEASCPFSVETENGQLAYGPVLGRLVGAEVSVVAWSGKGVVRNYGTDVVDPLPVLYPRVLPEDASSAFSPGDSQKADLVIVNLGTNDYSTDGDPPDQEFVDGYVALLEDIRTTHPDALIFCTIGPLLANDDLAAASKNIQAAVAARTAAGDANVRFRALTTPNDSPGCDWHPDVTTHQLMAEELQGFLEAEGWPN